MGQSIRDGQRECSILLVVVGLAVLREGAETVLFLHGIVATAGDGMAATLLGSGLGLALGVAVGYTLYAGLLRIPMRWFFAATGALVLLLAAGMASQAARFLIQADVLPSLTAPLWDTSSWIAETSVTGLLLRGLIGYDAQPAGMQMVFYGVVLVSIAVGMRLANQQLQRQIQAKQSAA
jgi:high-affinity iron transporter